MVQLQNILLPTEEICKVEELYYHKRENRVDFDGYFNLFYLEKRKKYTQIQDLILTVSIQGYKELILVHDGIDIGHYELDAEVCRRYEFPFPYEQYQKGCFWFSLVEDSKVKARRISGYFAAALKPDQIRDINIGIDICTFKREDYVAKNLERLKRQILDRSDLEVSSHVKIFIIDNGKTLQKFDNIQQMAAMCRDRVAIIPNKNAGGAGGFTRGMLEILKEKKQNRLTHVLLMDDDAVIEPDAVVRVYGFAATLREEWKDITIGGTMMREDYPFMLFCSGEWWKNGTIIHTRLHLDLRERKNATCQHLTETGHEHDRYSGWWCCCYSLNVVRNDNLPIPLFIHHDDIEFGLRNQKYGVVFLNGVSVWHKGFELTFPGTNVYYDARNQLVEIALHQTKGGKKTAIIYMLKTLIVATLRLKYRDVLLAYRGLNDFMKGPMWLYRQNPEKLNESVRKMVYPMQPLENIREQITENEYRSVMQQIHKHADKIDIDKIINFNSKRKKATFWHYITFNGWLLPAYKSTIKVVSPLDSPYDTFRQKKVVLYEPIGKKVILLKRSYRELLKAIRIYGKTIISLMLHFDTVQRDYQNNIGKLTNRNAWEEYLELR